MWSYARQTTQAAFVVYAGLAHDNILQVIVKALDPSKTESTASDFDSVSLTRKLELGLQKNSSYAEGAAGNDTIEYSFEVSTPQTMRKVDRVGLEHR